MMLLSVYIKIKQICWSFIGIFFIFGTGMRGGLYEKSCARGKKISEEYFR